MATGAEHYRTAEDLLRQADQTSGAGPGAPVTGDARDPRAVGLIQRAQVHATLAQAAATAWAHIADGRYVWGLYATCPDIQTANSIRSRAMGRSYDEKSAEVDAFKALTFISFEHDYRGEQVRVEHFAPAGNRLVWVVQIEDHEVYE